MRADWFRKPCGAEQILDETRVIAKNSALPSRCNDAWPTSFQTTTPLKLALFRARRPDRRSTNRYRARVTLRWKGRHNRIATGVPRCTRPEAQGSSQSPIRAGQGFTVREMRLVADGRQDGPFRPRQRRPATCRNSAGATMRSSLPWTSRISVGTSARIGRRSRSVSRATRWASALIGVRPFSSTIKAPAIFQESGKLGPVVIRQDRPAERQPGDMAGHQSPQPQRQAFTEREVATGEPSLQGRPRKPARLARARL